ncbi:hypothetical protein [Kiloniella antarctica]|uniref:Uncharacterized protein n=1 Tax=Kiloniella antarctica TaxID=1550907 RepID=A0ABW5BL66_9PROT
MATFDLATKIIQEDHRVWALHAGRGKRQYEFFSDHSQVFLELPGISLTEDTFESVHSIRQHLRMSMEVYRFSSGSVDIPPNRRAESYSGEPAEANVVGEKGLNAAVGNVCSLYRDAQIGDLVIVPGRGQYNPVLIGEIESNFSEEDGITVPHFNNEIIPTRRVRWINKNIEKRSFSSPLAKRLENRHAIINIRDGRQNNVINKLSLEVYRKVYDNFIWGGESKATFFGNEYQSKNPDGIIDTANVIKFLFAAYIASSRGEINQFSTMESSQAINRYYDTELINDFSFNFNSPGKIQISALRLAAIFVAMGIAVALHDVSFSEAISDLNFLNNNGVTIQLDPELGIEQCQGYYQGLMEALGEERYNSIKEECQKANLEMGLSTAIGRIN